MFLDDPSDTVSPDESSEHTPDDANNQDSAAEQSAADTRVQKDDDLSPDLSKESISSDSKVTAGVFDLSALPQAVEQDHWAIQKAIDRVEELKVLIQEKATERGLDYADDIKVLLIGSMETGHFTGPKPKEHSLNPNCPYDAVVEGDLRVIVPEHVDPHDQEAIDLVTDCLTEFGTLQKVETAKISRWDTDMHQTYFYQYDDISGDASVGYEWEVCLNNEPYYEIADAWLEVFSKEEVEQQVVIRELLRHLEVPLSTEFNPTKKIHCSECRWRIVASYALGQLTEEMGLVLPDSITKKLPFTGEPPKSIAWLVDMWLQGESGYSSVDRPTLTVVPAARTRIEEIADSVAQYDPELSSYLYGLLEPTQGPRWVRMANKIQRILKDRRDQQIDRGDDDATLQDELDRDQADA